jgi:hypothetical protein
MSDWTDLVESLDGNSTRRPETIWFLRAVAQLTGRPSAELDRILAGYCANQNVADVIGWERTRTWTRTVRPF